MEKDAENTQNIEEQTIKTSEKGELCTPQQYLLGWEKPPLHNTSSHPHHITKSIVI